MSDTSEEKVLEECPECGEKALLTGAVADPHGEREECWERCTSCGYAYRW